MALEQNQPSVMRRLRGAMLKYMPLMITCVEFENFVLDYLQGSLPKRQRRIFELHIRMCRECREYLAAYRTTVELARRALGEPSDAPAADVPEDLIKAVLAAREH